MMIADQIYRLLKDLKRFEYELSGSDRIWNILFPDPQKNWNHLRITKYRETFYLVHMDGELPALEAIPGKTVKQMPDFGSRSYLDEESVISEWNRMAESAFAWLAKVEKDWIRANKQVQMDYPLERRCGIVPHALVRASLKDVRRVDQELGKRNTAAFVRLVEEKSPFGELNGKIDVLSAADYFDYCRIAYIAGKRKDEAVDATLTGREMYERYADGRHEGLLDIDENSQQEFADWIDGTHPKRTGGGHPWEIKRGGNTTHIDLSVRRPPYGSRDGFVIELCGPSSSRLAETIKMFLALVKAGKAIAIADTEGVRARLLAQDNIGIVPETHSLHRANQRFPQHQNVYDVLHYHSLGRYKQRLKPFIAWEPLPVLKPVVGGRDC